MAAAHWETQLFTRIGRAVSRHPLAFVLIWAVVLGITGSLALTGWGGQNLFSRLTSSETNVPDTDSQHVADTVAEARGSSTTVTIVVTGVDVRTHRAQAGELVATLRDKLDVEHVASVTDAFSVLARVPGTDPALAQADPAAARAAAEATARAQASAQAMLAADGNGFTEVITLDAGLDAKHQSAAHEALDAALPGYLDGLHEQFPGAEAYQVSTRAIGDSIIDLVQKDLIRGESVGLPVALVLLVIVFGGLLAAGLPLVGALTSIGVGMGGLWLLTHVMGIDSFILNVISIIGLALSIDYGLLVVSRYREELAERLDADAAVAADRHRTHQLVRQCVARSIETAGRTVSFSALTIAFSIGGLLVMRSSILKTIALGGIIVTVIAVLSAVTLIPAIITLLGSHMVRPSVLARVPGLRGLVRAVGDASSDTGAFHKLAHRVIAHPWIIMVVVSAILALMASPIGTLRLRTAFTDYMPANSMIRTGYDTLQSQYPAMATPSITLIAEAPPERTGALVSQIEDLAHVTRVSPGALADKPGLTRIDVRVDASDQVGPEVSDMVRTLRGEDPGYRIWVGGAAASQIDFNHSLAQGAPWSALIIVVSVLVLLFLMTGSLIVPLKALLINSLSLVASLGVTAWLFEGGHLGLPQVNGLETFIVACMLAFGFGLAMDYEVFLLARIKEYWEAGHDNNEAVARGLQRSGRIITSAAAIIIAVFLGFVSGEMLAIKELGVALAIMVATDATLVRLLLVPSTMTVLGHWNWWAPRPLRKVYERFQLHH